MQLYLDLIEDPEADEDFFGVGKHGHSDGVAPDDGTGTRVRASNFVRQVQGELMAMMDYAFVDGDPDIYDQLSTDVIQPINDGVFGDASTAPTFEIDAPNSLNGDVLIGDLTITATGILDTNGYKVFVSGTLTIDVGGVIKNSGGDGEDGADGGVGGDHGPPGSLRGGGKGGAGLSNGVGNVGTAVTTSGGGSGGAGGADNGVNAGGAGGVAAPPVAAMGAWRRLASAVNGEVRGATAQDFLGGGAGGASGGCNGGIVTSGGGGGGGGVVIIWAKRLINNGTIDASGGDGGDGQGIGGGGGGGGGGLVITVARYRDPAGLGTVNVSGGAAGISAGGGQPGAAGSAGLHLELTA